MIHVTAQKHRVRRSATSVPYGAAYQHGVELELARRKRAKAAAKKERRKTRTRT